MKILFVHQGLQSFVKKDFDILMEKHEVRGLKFTGKKGLFFNLLPDLWKLLLGVIWCDFTFSWFGKLHAFFAVLFSLIFKKKSIVVAGGEDVVYAPEIKYGMFSFWWQKWCPLFVYRYADLILPPSEFHNQILMENAKPNSRKVKVINHAFDYNVFKKDPLVSKDGSVITVGGVTYENLTRKGLKLFVEAAGLLPSIRFMLIGPQPDDSIEVLKKIATPNVVFTGGVYGSDLIKVMAKATVYVQVSEYEGFGCSLAEAMLCEAVPVVSRKTALPMVVGDAGLYLDDLTAEDLAKNIRCALTMTEDAGKKARDRIIKNFPLEMRRQQLLEAVRTLDA